MAITAALTVALGLDSARFRSGLDRSQRRTQNFARRTRRQLDGLRNGFLAVSAAAAGIGAGVSFTRAADAFTNINNLLRSSGVAAGDLADTFGTVQTLAIATRADLEATGRLFSTLNRLSTDLALNQDQVALATQTIQQAFAVAGTDANSAANAVRQLVQGLESGVLRGEEFNSINENANILIRTIAENPGVSVGMMRELAAQGMLTSDVVIQGILGGARDINASFQETNQTFSQVAEVFEARITPVLARIGTMVLPAVAATLEFTAQTVSNLLGFVGRLNISFQAMRIIIIAIGVAAFRTFGVALGSTVLSAAAALAGLLRTLTAVNVSLRATTILAALSSGNFIAIAANVAAMGAAFVVLNELLPEATDDFIEANNAAADFSNNLVGVNIELDAFNDAIAGTTAEAPMVIEELDEGFQRVGRTIQTSLRDSFVEAFRTGELSARSFFNAITSSILQVSANALTNNLLGSVFQALPAAGSFLGFQNGGVVPRIPGSRPGVDSVPALLTPGEIVTPVGEIPGGVTIVNNFSVDTPETFRRQAEGSAAALADIVESQFAQRGFA